MLYNCTKAEKKSITRLYTILIIVTVLVPAICGVATSFVNEPTYTPIYESYVTLIYNSSFRDEINIDEEKAFTEDIASNRNLIPTCIEIIKSNAILDNVSEEIRRVTDNKISSNEIRKMMSVENIENTDIIKITIRCEDRVLAREIANEIGRTTEEKIEQYVPIGLLKIVDTAKISLHPVNDPPRKVNPIIVAGIGLFVCVIVDIVLITGKRKKYKTR